MKMISSILAEKWFRIAGVFFLTISFTVANAQPAKIQGVGTWNEETQTVLASDSSALRHLFRIHLANAITNPEVALRLREWLASPTAEESRRGIAGVIRSLHSRETPEALGLIADDFEDDGKSAWRVRLYFDRNVDGKIWYIEVTLEVALADIEIDAVQAYTIDRTNGAGKEILTGKFTSEIPDAAARKVLGLGSSDASLVATR